MRIPDDKIDEVRTAADIIDVISAYLPLKRRGRNYLALCPFHDEKTPSFSVSPDKQIFHCFGCGKGGNVFTFLMEHDKLSFIEAITALADRYGISLPRYEKEPDTRTERMLYANQVAADFYHSILKREAYRDKIEAYLYTRRGLKPETVERFQIGLAPDEWHALLDFARKKDLTPKELEEAGLALKSDKTGEYYDRFRLRLMFPIYNMVGRIVAFGGRALSKGETAKYMNSPETPIYSKSHILYGLHASKGAIREAEAVILVEGYFDFLSLFQAGIENVAAVSGTAFTPQQARLLARFARKAYLFFDADSAGQNAALRSVEYFFDCGIEPMIVTPPPTHDPDSLVRQFGGTEVLKQISQGVPYLAFRFDRVDMSALSMPEKERVVREIKALAGKIEDPLRRDIFVASAAEILRLPVGAVTPGEPQQKAPTLLPDRVRNIQIIESELLSLFVNRPQLIELVWDDIAPDDLNGPGHRGIYTAMIGAYRESGRIDPDRLIEHLTGDVEKSGLALIATIDWGDLDLTGVVKEYKRMLLNQKRQVHLADIKQKLAAAEKRGDHDQAEKLMREIKYLLEKRL